MEDILYLDAQKVLFDQHRTKCYMRLLLYIGLVVAMCSAVIYLITQLVSVVNIWYKMSADMHRNDVTEE